MPDQTEVPTGPSDLELKLRFMQSAIAALPLPTWKAIHETLTEAQKKDPSFAAAVMAEKVARAATAVFRSEKREKKNGGGSWES